MAKNNRSQYGGRRRKRSALKKRRTAHPAAIVAGIALLIAVAWHLNASEQSEATTCDTAAEALMKVDVPASTPEQIVNYKGFTVSFNAEAHQPNYVAWELTAAETGGDVTRNVDFAVDRNVVGSAELSDYRRSGFDRGHMIPAADVKWDAEAMAASHFLTNICPQDHKLNAGAWATLEGNCRQWALRDSAIVIICGPVLSDVMPRSIGSDGRIIPVPERFFKVVAAPYSNPPCGIGFLMNNGPVNGGVQAAAVTIDEVEAATGFDFFAALPDEIENEIEAQCAYHEWQRKSR